MSANPYVEARRDWDERYADLVLGKRNWQIAAGGLLVLSIMLAAGFIWLSSRIAIYFRPAKTRTLARLLETENRCGMSDFPHPRWSRRVSSSLVKSRSVREVFPTLCPPQWFGGTGGNSKSKRVEHTPLVF